MSTEAQAALAAAGVDEFLSLVALQQPTWPDAEAPDWAVAADPGSPWNDTSGWWLNLLPRPHLYLPEGDGHEAVAASGEIHAPMPGKVVEVFVAVGDVVEKGQKLLILGAMKIEHTMKATRAGTVRAVHAVADSQVGDKALLVEIE